MRLRPFLKWPGGKFRLLDKLLPYFPVQHPVFVEPFVGSGAIVLNTSYAVSLAYDANPDVIALFQILKDGRQRFIRDAKKLFNQANNEKTYYLRYRELFNAHPHFSWQRAALFLYLNRHGYNGLCRYNQQGIFNVPFGRYVAPYFPEKEMHAFMVRAKNITFTCASFETALAAVPEHAVVYCDPPYVPLSDTAYFTQYGAKTFDWDAQVALAMYAETLAARGITVLISNHDTKATRALYAQATMYSFDVPRYISCSAEKRKPVRELLAVYKR